MYLFVIYIGGTHKQSLIELHDMRFVVANSIEDTYPSLRQSWWGIPTSLHLDAWGILDYADGYNIHISTEPPKDNANKLYFVNLGGYDPQQFTELHKNIFVVATDEQEAKQKALQQISEWESPHRDHLHQIEATLELNGLLASDNHYLHLTKAPKTKSFSFTCRYVSIGKLASP
ncbi:DUF1543 domain-containing protein [Legionella feeleii]|uniref:Domain of Uncharacterized Function (DUF1543) n=1 Tax=Legionella feeleii TaxID=453 RepID=A0A0W0TTA4_9GAMM|nr:DUF1543 domain-containing protein [Legionella feeleii]KTC98742.1 hypothetical protein Lfee_1492 [Legionella feeleii]SPX62793.1 Domain of Uncharacterised Function (DUF1543) [Legionella feeleii]